LGYNGLDMSSDAINTYRTLLRKLPRKIPLEDRIEDGRMILKWIINKLMLIIWI
jgi:hypothetical protein